MRWVGDGEVEKGNNGECAESKNGFEKKRDKISGFNGGEDERFPCFERDLKC